ncbi:MAG: Rpn family recombination-promoting nuclease/putative transposase [Treponema sp.]|nr:Rpn family recombination-promoting nuclease/putative transposase [Treponema sp.]
MKMTNEQNLTPEEKWEQATLANNFIFYKVMRNHPDICKELLEILLEFKIDRIEMSQEEEIDIDFGSKGIRMDVYATNETQAYNIEMQALNTKELPERSRYYQGVIDVDQLKSGAQYKDLKTTFIIFICMDDIFGKGLAKYTFENICREDGKTPLNDRTYKYFFISCNCDTLLNKEQQAFLRMLIENKSTTDFTSRISHLVAEAKHNTQWRKQFMDFDREKAYAREDGYTDGLNDGMQQKAIEDATEFLKENVSPEVIARCVKLPLEKVLEIQKQISVTA